jgi:hydrogenase maturation protease
MGKENKKELLLFGYGNPDRGDDGAAFHIFLKLIDQADSNNLDILSAEVSELTPRTDIIFNFQLLPENAELVSKYEKVIFIDAHTGEIKDEIRYEKIAPEMKHSPFTHHFAPASCLALAKSITGYAPEAWLLSIRGYQFGFTEELSQQTSDLVDRAVQLLKTEYLI